MVHFYTRVFLFFVGLLIGILIGKTSIHLKDNSQRKPSYNEWFKTNGLIRKKILWDTLRYDNSIKPSLEATFLYTRIQIFCIILVRSEKNAKASNSTWGKGCNNNIEFLEIKRPKFVPVKRVKENSSWNLLCQTLKNIPTEYDWVLVVNDNNFVIMENLRYFLAPLKSTAKYYLGYAVLFWSTVYNSGQAGYVLSRGTVNALKEKFAQTDCSTNAYWNREDFYLGRYLASLNITPIDTRDSEGYSTFHPNNWHQLFFPTKHHITSVFPTKCCSKNSISFQASEGDKMYTYHYLLYTLQIFMDGRKGNVPNSQAGDDNVWQKFLREQNIISDNVTSEQYYKVWENLIDDPTSFGAHMKKEIHFDYE